MVRVCRVQIVIPIKKLSADVLTALNTAESQGLLYVRVKGAKDIKSGESYAKVTVSGQKKKTEVRKHSGTVEWRDQLDFLIHDVDNDVVTVEVKSKENALLNTVNTLVINHLKTSRSTALGDITIPLNRVSSDDKANIPQDMWLPLHHQHKGRTGQVHVELTWAPFIKEDAAEAVAAGGGDESKQGVGDASKPALLRRRSTRARVGSEGGKIAGLLAITVHSAAGLKKPSSGHAPHHAYVTLTVGDVTQKTSALPGESVTWDAPFEVRVEDCSEAVLRLEVKEKTPHLSLSLGMAKDQLLGEVLLNVKQLHAQGRKRESLPLQKSHSATITITTEVRET